MTQKGTPPKMFISCLLVKTSSRSTGYISIADKKRLLHDMEDEGLIRNLRVANSRVWEFEPISDEALPVIEKRLQGRYFEYAKRSTPYKGR